MHLHHQLTARRHRVAETRIKQCLVGARCPMGHPGCVVTSTRVTKTGPTLPRGVSVEPTSRIDVGRAEPEEDRVMHDGGVLRQELTAGQEGPAGEPGIDQEAAVFIGSTVGRRRRVGLRHGQFDEAFASPQRRRRWRLERDAVAIMGGTRLRGVTRIR